MLISRRLRPLVASFSLALVCTLTQAPAFARTQEANFVRLTTTTAADLPSSIRGDLLLANDGNIYFPSATGGPDGYGFIGKATPDGTLSTVYAFGASKESINPYAGVIQGADGNLYGTSFLGGTEGAGTVFRLTLAGQYTVLHSFGESSTAAALPYTGLTQTADGKLYGTTLRGGSNDKGTIYRISVTGSDFEIVHHFNGSDGENPEGRLIVGSDGELYGTTLQGGPDNRGTVYRISTSGTLTTLYSFERLSAFNAQGIATNATGANPRAGLLLAADGNYYGTTYQGGPGGFGTVFRMTPGGVVTLLRGFVGASWDGGAPLAGVVQDSAGNFYGTTQQGGYLDTGSAWRISSSGVFSLLHGFVDSGADGIAPQSALLLANGSIYGASYSDSVLGKGALFKLDLGTGGVLPIEISVSPTEIMKGSSATVTWSSPTAASCNAAGSWTNGATTVSGTLVVTPTAAANYTYVLSCTDGAGVVRNAYTFLTVKAPPLEPVDGGGGAGALSVPLLLLLAALLFRKNLKEIFTACP